MKKVLSITLITLLLSTTISFCQPSNNTIASVKDLNMVEDNLGIIIKNILLGEYDEVAIRKSLRFNESILQNIYNNTIIEYKADKAPLKRREDVSILYISALYKLSINALDLYLDDKNMNDMFLLDSISEYREGNQILNIFKETLRKSYKIDIQ